MLKKEILRKKEDFSDIYKRGKSIPERYIVLFYKKNDLPYNRISFLASKKVGNSVQRNRAKRLMKESYRHICTDIKEGYDIILIARNTILDRKCDDVRRSLERAVKKGNLYKG
ncbi:MAG: ribonuclease P protein component [Firmicutes bacterium]|nr:ribonuclease P protein component [Bacillota bacterium]